MIPANYACFTSYPKGHALLVIPKVDSKGRSLLGLRRSIQQMAREVFKRTKLIEDDGSWVLALPSATDAKIYMLHVLAECVVIEGKQRTAHFRYPNGEAVVADARKLSKLIDADFNS